jgi:hypothetical protein
LRRHQRLFDRNDQITHRRRHPVTRVQLIDKFGAYRLQQVGCEQLKNLMINAPICD